MRRNSVGARELKVRLGKYLRSVREGRTLIVTDRGQPIAELKPVGLHGDVEAILARLETVGAITRPTSNRLSQFRPIESDGESAAAAIAEERDDRF